MSTNSDCLTDEALLAIRDGEEISAELRSHLADCDDCRQRVAGLDAAIRSLREVETAVTILDVGDGTVNRIHGSSLATYREESPSSDQSSGGGGPPADKSQPGRFQLIRLLGKGAFGEVHLAFDPHLDRQVAIKVAQRGVLARRSQIDRFRREAQAAAQLRHPHIIPVYDFEQSESLNYIVYEFVEGQTLRSVLGFRRRLDQRESAVLVRKLADALHYAHSHGIVHRDIKPDNILIDQAGEPHIADFGLAYRDEAETLRTREGILMGTPAYMSPEQASGRGHDVDARADIWSLGVLFQEALTGERPFEGPLNSILSAIQKQDPKPIKDETISADLVAICQMCLAKDAGSRYQTAEELSADLRRWLRGEEVTVRRWSSLARSWRWMRRNTGPASLAAGVIAFLLAMVGIVYYSAMSSAARAELSERQQNEQALAQVTALRAADPESVAYLIGSLAPHSEKVLPRLRELLGSDLSPREQTRLRLGLVLLGEGAPEHEQLSALLTTLKSAESGEFLMIRDRLLPFAGQLTDELWMAALHERDASTAARFRAQCALALYDPQADYWEQIATNTAEQLLVGGPEEVVRWARILAPVRDRLLPTLLAAFERGEDKEAKSQAARVLAALLHDQPDQLADLLVQAEPSQLRPMIQGLRPHAGTTVGRLRAVLRGSPSEQVEPRRAKEMANSAVGLLGLGRGDLVWPLLAMSRDNTVRTAIVHRLGPAGIDPALIVEQLDRSDDTFVISALLLGLGEYRSDVLNQNRRKELIPTVLGLFRSHPDPGVHAAVDWLTRRWRLESQIHELKSSLESRDLRGERRWYVNRQGQTMAVFAGPLVFNAGSPAEEVDRGAFEQRQEKTIPHSFAISMKEITNEQFRRFKEHAYPDSVRRYSLESDCPVIYVTWYDAVRFCRWLSEQEEIPEDQMCFPPIGEIGPDMPAAKIRLERGGYRLPTSAEWEFACRAGASTSRHFGNGEAMLPEYAWYNANSQNHAWPVGLLKPNGFGLFDVHGNAAEWCQDPFQAAEARGLENELTVDSLGVGPALLYELRGGTFLHPPSLTRCAYRDFQVGNYDSYEFGFRVARTYNGDVSSGQSQ